MNKRIIIGAVVAALLVTAWLVWGGKKSEDAELFTQVQKGDFRISVSTTGELAAKKSIDIVGPMGMRAAQIWQVQISSIVDEGTVVKKGEKVVELDKSALQDKLKSAETELTKAESQYTQVKLDTTLTLREARDNLVNLKFSEQQKKLELEQSAFEPPATIKQAEISMQKALRDYLQAKENYEVKVDQAKAKMREVAATLANEQNKVDFLNKLSNEFSIVAPEDGMLIYTKDWNGQKKKQGSTLNAWDPTVASLPDLTSMTSITYVNEVDIRRIKLQQNVEIGLDAFPDKHLTGTVTSVANMGEQRPNSDAKVFEVKIDISESDTTLRPSMTTSNIIVADVLKDVRYVPLEAVQSLGDTLTFVYKKDGTGFVKQEVKVGATNDQSIVIEKGLSELDAVMISTPKESEVELIRLPTSDVVAKKQ